MECLLLETRLQTEWFPIFRRVEIAGRPVCPQFSPSESRVFQFLVIVPVFCPVWGYVKVNCIKRLYRFRKTAVFSRILANCRTGIFLTLCAFNCTVVCAV